VGRRRAIDAFRRRSALDERYAALARDLGEGGASSAGFPAPARGAGAGAAGAADLLWDPDQIDDDVLALVFTACHPVLSREARVALTLRVVGGLTSDEIARAFLVPAATVQARITRAKKTLAAARVPFATPPAAERPERLGSVLSVIYLIFTEGSSASSGGDLIRFDLAGEAQRLARVLARLMPDEPEAHGLLALLELTAARFPARTGPDGEPVLLEQQDRRRWDQGAIHRGRAALARAGQAGRGLGPYGLQAAIAECHAVAPSVAATDWERVVALYQALGQLAPSPVVDLNGRWRSPWPPGRPRRWRSRTSWRRPGRSPGRTCCPVSAVSCWPGSAATTRPGPSWGGRWPCAATSASAACCGASWAPWPAATPRLGLTRTDLVRHRPSQQISRANVLFGTSGMLLTGLHHALRRRSGRG